MNAKRIFYVYVVFRLSGIPCYIGKGCKGRWQRHFRKSHNPHLANIIKAAGGELPVVIVRANLTAQEAFETEIALIAIIGRGCNGPLVNETDGGDGPLGHRQTAEHKAKIAAANRGRKRSQRECEIIGDRRRGVKATDETLERLRLSHLGKKQSRELVEKRIAPLRGRKRDADMMEKIRQTNIGRKRSPETRENIRRGSLGKVLSADHKQKIRERTKVALADPVVREKLSIAAKAQWAAWRERRAANGG